MERKEHIYRYVTLAALCALMSLASYAQQTPAQRIYSAYTGGDMARWKDVLAEMERLPPDDVRKELTEYYYGYVGYLIGLGRKEEAEEYIGRADRLIGEWLEARPDDPSALAMKGVFTAFRIPLDKIKAPVLGPRSMKLIRRAYRADPSDAMALSAMGSMLYHAPAIFGGDKAEGTSYIRRAAERLEEEGRAAGNWFYLSLMVMLAQFTEQQDDLSGAARIYEKILAAEPDFAWVRDELYPSLKGRLPN